MNKEIVDNREIVIERYKIKELLAFSQWLSDKKLTDIDKAIILRRANAMCWSEYLRAHHKDSIIMSVLTRIQASPIAKPAIIRIGIPDSHLIHT